MPITQSAKKALRRDRRRTTINVRIKRKIKATLKLARREPTKKNLAAAYSALDRAAKKKIIHKNKASRLKSRLMKFVKKIKEEKKTKKETPKKTAKKKSRAKKKKT